MRLSQKLREALMQPLAPDMRLMPGDDVGPGRFEGGTPAAVLVPVVDRPEPGLLLTLRNANMRKHAGQVAFPGGRIDPEDDGPIGAALREAQEEIGLSPHAVEIIGTIEPYITVTDYLVTPVLAVIPPDLPLSPHEAEVAAVFEVPLSFLRDPANWQVRSVLWQGHERRVYEVHWEDRRIWGATAAMIVNIGRRLALAG
jgi:8-oxo-dGTP pyrophosphatase MutT (NUDIX family)